MAQWGKPARDHLSDDAAVRFARHARNEMRLYGFTTRELMDAIADASGWISIDPDGNIAVVGFVGSRRVTVVLASDELDLVITIYGGRRGRR